jgi:hypothetical protein
MKIAALIEQAQRTNLSPLKKDVLDYLEQHDDEVFRYQDAKLARDLKAKPSAIGFTLWALHRDGLVKKQKVGKVYFFGSKQAIEELRTRLGIAAEDPFERATRNLERIRERVGEIDAVALLDEVREGN